MQRGDRSKLPIVYNEIRSDFYILTSSRNMLTFSSVSTSMIFSFSSDTIRQAEKECFTMLIKRSLDMTSSFFCSSPVVFVDPATPYLK